MSTFKNLDEIEYDKEQKFSFETELNFNDDEILDFFTNLEFFRSRVQ